jgi:hypothetical protein
MSLVAMPAAFSPSISRAMATLLRDRASRAVSPSVTTPAEMVARSGTADTWPLADTLTNRSAVLSSAAMPGPAITNAAATSSAVAAEAFVRERIAKSSQARAQCQPSDTSFVSEQGHPLGFCARSGVVY